MLSGAGFKLAPESSNRNLIGLMRPECVRIGGMRRDFVTLSSVSTVQTTIIMIAVAER